MFIFISTAIIVKGYTRDCIYDLDRFKFFYVPKTLTNILEIYSGKTTWKTVENDFKNEKLVITEYYDFLMKNDLIFFTNDTECFKDLDLSWFNSSKILNAIIEVKEKLNFIKIVNQLDELNCKSYEIRIHKSILFNELIEVLEILNDSKAREVSLVFSYNIFTLDQLKHLIELCNKVLKISTFKAKENKSDEFNIRELKVPIIYHTMSIKEFEKIFFNTYGIVNLNFFSESQIYNTYLNRKIFIDDVGNIYNSPQSKEIYGNIGRQTISNILDLTTFKDLWRVGKDKIDVCKDCEFRHMCMDNRIPYQKKDGNWFHQEECNYNPYICTWKDEEGYQSLSKCGVVSDENEFSINHEKIAEINKNLWEEKPENA